VLFGFSTRSAAWAASVAAAAGAGCDWCPRRSTVHALTETAASFDSPLGPIATFWQVKPLGICGLVPENAVQARSVAVIERFCVRLASGICGADTVACTILWPA
jgi:hypothetical protein